MSAADSQPESARQLVPDSRVRSLAKALSWRVVATFTTMAIAYLITGSLDMAALIGGIEFFLKIGVFYLHERLWTMLPQR